MTVFFDGITTKSVKNTVLKEQMKPILTERLVCPACGQALVFMDEQWACSVCPQSGKIMNRIPLFSPVAGDIVPFEKQVRAPGLGTPWRQANWKFLLAQMDRLSPGSVILDVGAGHGDFTTALAKHEWIALDIYPYPELDIICDLTQVNPFRLASFDAVVLMNVLEHVCDSRTLLTNLAALLKPGGTLLVAIPFLIKIHQAPYDFVRYTEYALSQLGQGAGLELASLEAYDDPVFLIGESRRNLERWGLRAISKPRRILSRGLLLALRACEFGLERLVKGFIRSADSEVTPAPVGYHAEFRKPG